MLLSFRDIFTRYGKLFRQYLQTNIEQQVGIDGIAMIPSKGGVRGGKRSKKLSKVGTHPRLQITGKLAKNSFKSESSDNTLRIYGNNAIHSNGVSYGDILYYNNKPTSQNTNSPLVFPTNEAELNMTPIFQQLQSEMTTELVTYFTKTAGVDIKATLKLG